MISVILSGGLGNQMYQYAAAKALSVRFNTGIYADLYALNKQTNATFRKYGLNVFSTDLPIKNKLRNKLAIKSLGCISNKKLNDRLLNTSGIFRDNSAQFFDPKFDNLKNGTTLYGYFQNELYFSDVESELRNDFIFRIPLSDKNTEIASQINNSQSASIHIRRGDYLNSNSNLAPLNVSYYAKAIELIKNKTEDTEFFVFSDEIEWVKQNLDFGNNTCHYIDENKGESNYIDMQLMSICKHNIIANSSFSWWGAWLNNNPDKVVIAPDKWYKNDINNNYPEGFIPSKWIVL